MEWTREDIENICKKIAREIAGQVVTERFEGIGLDDSDIEHRQINIKNNFLLNSLRVKQEEAVLKNSLKDIAIQVIGQGIWVVTSGLVAWAAIQICQHIK
jgi:cytochrome b involved in lipid metabolism